jgi:hypothetical protein
MISVFWPDFRADSTLFASSLPPLLKLAMSSSTSVPPVENEVVLRYRECWRDLHARFIKSNNSTPQCLEEIEGGVAFSRYNKDMALGLVCLISGKDVYCAR